MRACMALLLAAGALQAADYRVVVAGLGGEPDYDMRFHMMAGETLKLMGGEGEMLAGAKATKANLKVALAGAAARNHAEDSLTLVLIGHGTFDGLVYKFNVQGPDVTAEELRGWLDAVPGKQLVVLATSCSGAAAEVLKRENRAVITATKSGTEKNAVVFSRYWVDALRDAAADTDKNETLTAAEAFQFAKVKTAGFYEAQKRLATEHPLMDDSAVAARFALLRLGTAQKASNDPAKRELLHRKDQLEAAIDKLKLEKAAMPLDEYKSRLNGLLVDLAKVQEEIEK